MWRHILDDIQYVFSDNQFRGPNDVAVPVFTTYKYINVHPNVGIRLGYECQAFIEVRQFLRIICQIRAYALPPYLICL
jgi:hypothetical protein